jgi:glucose/mannose-6-phosphate isomerase
MTDTSIKHYDKSNMRKLLIQFPGQVEEAVRIGGTVKLPFSAGDITSVVVTGLGGSAIGADLLRSYLASELKVPFIVNRNYELPEFVGPKTLVVVSSYSGNTEETIAAYADARKRKARIACISSGGEISKIAQKSKHPLLTIPKGLPPRAALGFSFFPLLGVVTAARLVRPRKADIAETVKLLTAKAKAYSANNDKNPALRLAKDLYTKLPVIYSASDRFDVVNLRWRGQFAENSKQLAFGHVIPEMNHNELVGWKVLRRVMEEDITVVFLRDRGDHKRVQLRMGITNDIVSQYSSRVREVWSEGRSLLARTFSLVSLGDWVSFYLAILNGIDPTPVKVIDYLKNELSKVK